LLKFTEVSAELVIPKTVTANILLLAESVPTSSDVSLPTVCRLLPVIVLAKFEPDMNGRPPINKLPRELIEDAVRFPTPSTVNPGPLKPEDDVNCF
jgi:hypothetical protein